MAGTTLLKINGGALASVTGYGSAVDLLRGSTAGAIAFGAISGAALFCMYMMIREENGA